jgi:chemotaxis protein CheD
MMPSPPPARAPLANPDPPANAASALGGSARLARLKALPRKPDEASYFYWDAHFHNDAVKVLPGEYFVSDEDLLITTTLGSCIAACLWDRERRIGGMNHFVLPEGAGKDGASSGGRYGSGAMELLIQALLNQGATRMTLEAKIFGGGAVIGGMSSVNVGELNTRFVIDYLQTERIPIVSRDVLEVYPRKVCFLPASGKAMVKRLAPTHGGAFVAQDRAAAQKAGPSTTGAGSVDLF